MKFLESTNFEALLYLGSYEPYKLTIEKEINVLRAKMPPRYKKSSIENMSLFEKNLQMIFIVDVKTFLHLKTMKLIILN